MDNYNKEEPLIFALNASKRFGEKLGAKGKVYETRFPDGEPYIRPDQDIRGGDVFVVQSLHNYDGSGEGLEEKAFKLFMFCNAAHHASAKRITAAIPYLALTRQDRKTEGRAPLSAQMLSRLLEASFVDRLLTMDPHNSAIQSAYTIPSDILSPLKPLIDYLHPTLIKEKRIAIIAPDAGAIKERAKPLQKRIIKYFDGNPPFEIIRGFVDKDRISGSETKAEGFYVYGDITDALTIIPDDESSTGKTMIDTAELAKQHGAGETICFIVHNKLKAKAAKKIQENRGIDRFIVMDTICRPEEFFKKYPKFEELSSADYFKKAIENIHEEISLSNELF